MTGQMPARDGDTVILHTESPAAPYVLWVVLSDGQQQPRPDQYASTTVGRTMAFELARLMARENRGAVFFPEVTTGTWIKVS
jgi:hypothetical protein